MQAGGAVFGKGESDITKFGPVPIQTISALVEIANVDIGRIGMPRDPVSELDRNDQRVAPLEHDRIGKFWDRDQAPYKAAKEEEWVPLDLILFQQYKENRAARTTVSGNDGKPFVDALPISFTNPAGATKLASGSKSLKK